MGVFDIFKKKVKDEGPVVRRFGWKRDLPDHRDFKYKVVAPHELPPVADLRAMFPEAYDQGSLGSCTANALGGAFEFDQIKQGKEHWTPSRLFIYYNERILEDTVNEDSGAEIRNGIKTMVKDGVCPEWMWEYNIDRFKVQPDQKCYGYALDNQVLQYFRITPHTVYEVKHCLAEGYPVAFGFMVFDSFMTEKVMKTGMAPIPSKDESANGGHAVLAVGYDDSLQCFIVRNSWGCYDDNTEVLTKEGFMYFKDIVGEEEFATLTTDGRLEYQLATENIVAPYSGKMRQFKSSKVDLVVTPNHNMYIKSNPCKKEFEFITADSITTKRFKVKRDCEWEGITRDTITIPGYTHNVNSYKTIEIPELELNIDDYLAFLGYFISEGSISVSNCKRLGREYSISIAQQKPSNRIIMEEDLRRLPFSIHSTKQGFSFTSKQLYLHLSQFGLCNNKFIPKDILQLDKSKLKILYDALMLGDGSINRSNNTYKVTYYTASKQLADDVQELCLKLGYSSSIYKDDRVGEESSNGYNYNYIGYQVRIQNSFSKTRTKLHTVENNLEAIDYDGNVYCVTVPNHTLFVRRNGKTCWCGNSNWGINGYFYMPYWFVETPNVAADFWTIRLVE